MTTEGNARKKRVTRQRKSPATRKRADAAPRTRTSAETPRRRRGDAPGSDGGLTGKLALALWELVIKGDGKMASERSIKLTRSEAKRLESARLVAIEAGPRKSNPAYASKLHLTEEGWHWANHHGLTARLARSKIAASLLEALLEKICEYLRVNDLALDHLLRPRRAGSERDEATSTAAEERVDQAPGQPAPASLEERIRAAYLRVTRGALNQYVRLALLRAELGDEMVEMVDSELRAMQQRGIAVLYPIDDPQRLRPEDDAAALRVSGERRDLLCIKG